MSEKEDDKQATVITKASHKSLLYELFFVERQDGSRTLRQFPIDKIGDASSAAKKLREGGKEDNKYVTFIDSDIELTAEEWVILKDLLREKKEANILQAEPLAELRDIFQIK